MARNWLRCVIPSRGRAESDLKSLELFPGALLLVPKGERSAYARRCSPGRIETYPDSLLGIPKLKNYMRRHFAEECLVFCDDDIITCYTLTDFLKHNLTPSQIMAVLHRTAIAARDAGSRLFGFNQAWDVRKVLM